VNAMVELQETIAASGAGGRKRPRRAERTARLTLAEAIRQQIADQIMAGTLPPGTRLDETELAQRFDASRTPVREAVRLLGASGLVEMRAHRAAIVARPSRERLNGMFEVMADLEALCAGFSAERMAAQERRGIERLHESLRMLVHSGDPQRYHEANESFHSAFYSGAHNDYLAELTLATRLRLSPFRRAQFRNLGRLATSHEEHDRVVLATLRGDCRAAADAMRQHVIQVHVEYEVYAELP
jgi:DNA-binding GntR family transcriptional regulator